MLYSGVLGSPRPPREGCAAAAQPPIFQAVLFQQYCNNGFETVTVTNTIVTVTLFESTDPGRRVRAARPLRSPSTTCLTQVFFKSGERCSDLW